MFFLYICSNVTSCIFVAEIYASQPFFANIIVFLLQAAIVFAIYFNLFTCQLDTAFYTISKSRSRTFSIQLYSTSNRFRVLAFSIKPNLKRHMIIQMRHETTHSYTQFVCYIVSTRANATSARKLFPCLHKCLSLRDSFTSSFSLVLVHPFLLSVLLVMHLLLKCLKHLLAFLNLSRLQHAITAFVTPAMQSFFNWLRYLYFSDEPSLSVTCRFEFCRPFVFQNLQYVVQGFVRFYF